MARAKIQPGNLLQDRKSFELRQLVLGNLTHVAVGFHQLCHTLVIERSPKTIDDNVLAIEFADQGNHRFGQGFTFFPIGEVVI